MLAVKRVQRACTIMYVIDGRPFDIIISLRNNIWTSRGTFNMTLEEISRQNQLKLFLKFYCIEIHDNKSSNVSVLRRI